MSFLNPWLLLLLPLAGLPFFVSKRPPAVTRRLVSDLELWRAAVPPFSSHLAPRPRRDWLAWPRALCLVALVAAAAGPIAPAAPLAATFIVDLSASMGATDESGTRLESARRAALEEAGRLDGDARVRLLGAGTDVVDLGVVRSSELRERLADLAPGPGDARLEDAVTLARAEAAGTTHVFSDLAAPADAGITWHTVGRPVANVAITTLVARRRDRDPHLVETLVEVSNYGPTAAAVDVELGDGAGLVERRALRVPARSGRIVTTDLATSADGVTVRIDAESDALASDDVRQATVAPERAATVWLPGASNRFLERALDANPRVRVVRGGDPPDGATVVCAGCDAAPPPARALLLLPAPDADALPPATLAVSAPGHAITRGLDLSEAVVAVAAPPPDVDATPIVVAGGMPIVMASEGGGRRIVYLNAHLTAPGFPVSTAFPILMANILEWLADTNAAPPSAPRPAAESDLWSPQHAVVPAGAVSAPATGQTRAAVAAPLVALMLLLALALLTLDGWVHRRRNVTIPVARFVAALLIVAAVADVPLPAGRETRAVVFAIDQSESVSLVNQREAIERLGALSRNRQRRDGAGVVVFGVDPALDQPVSQTPLDPVSTVAPGGGTDIEATLDLARRLLPPRGRIVLMSDGRETDGDARRAADRAAEDSIAIDVVPPSTPDVERVARVRTVHAPARVREGEAFAVAVSVTGPPAIPVDVVLIGDDGERTTARGTLDVHGSATLTFPRRRSEAGSYSYRAVIGDGQPSGSDPGASVTVEGTSRLLYVSLSTRSPLPFEAAGFAVTPMSPAQIPAVRSGLDAYDAVVVDEMDLAAIPPSSAAAIRDYVERDGGGLLVLAGPSTVAGGVPEAGSLDAVLPIDFRARAGGRGTSLAYVLVFDKSGSMADAASGVPKIEMARESVMRVLDVLPPDASFGVIAFDREPRAVLPLRRSHDRREVARLLAAIEPSGATAIAPALRRAVDWLSASGADRQRVLIVTDGRTPEQDAARLRAASAADDVEISMVAIGADADRALLEEVARRTGGHAYFPADLRQLPAIVSQDAAHASGPPFVVERFVPRTGPHQTITDVEVDALPSIGGYVVGRTRSGADAILTSHLDDPVMAAWSFGLGRVVTFTGGLGSAWGSDMRSWRGAPRLWAQTLRWVARGRSSDLDVDVIETDAGGRVLINTERDSRPPLALIDPTVSIRRPDGSLERVRAMAVAPGSYEASFVSNTIGPHGIVISATGEAGDDIRDVQLFFRAAVNERLTRGADVSALRALAERTGGRVLAPDDSPFDGPRGFAWRGAQPLFALLAAAVFLADLAGGDRIRRAGRAAMRRRPEAA